MDYDVLAEDDARENRERQQYLNDLSQVLGTTAGQNVAVAILDKLGMGYPVMSEGDRLTYNTALRLFHDMEEARPEAARTILARVMI